MAQRSRLSTIQSGASGEYFVAAELSRRGILAALTMGNSRGVDLIASDVSGSRSVSIQVKTNQHTKRSWVLSSHADELSSPNYFYVFVNLNGEDGMPSFHVVPSSIVSKYCSGRHKAWISGTKRDGTPRKDTSMRKFADFEGEYLARWDLLEINH